MAQVYGAGGKTLPKKGRLGTGSYYPQGTPLYLHKGNTFPGIQIPADVAPQISFGDTTRAAIATQAGQNRVRSKALHPNQPQYNTITQPLAPAMISSSANEKNNLHPVPPSRAVLTMPHERNTNSAAGVRKKPRTYRTVFGTSSSLAVDTAFVRNPDAQYIRSGVSKPGPATEAVKKSVPDRTFARVPNPLPVHDAQVIPRRTPPASFVSRGNNWYDPNNSFINGHTSTAGAGKGRWHVVKKGVV
jgi:hypothetical protein